MGVAAAAGTGVLTGALPGSAGRASASPATTAAVPVLHWHGCASPAATSFQCATARVPLDYSAPTGRTIEIAVIRHRATGPGRRLGSIFINYGGPGGAGVASLPPTYYLVPAELRQRFDIVSFDPRGVGTSTAIKCFPDAAADIRFYAGLPQGFPVGLAESRLWIGSFARLGQLCARRAGSLLPHVSTADVAKDMDLLRQAVGDPAMNYLGLSYGTYLGATYANLFPGKVRALVFDGALAPTAWARPGSAGGLSLGTFMRVGMDQGRAATLGQFLGLCGQVSTSRCAFSAGTPNATRAKYQTLLWRLRRRPVVITIPGQGPVRMTYAGLVDYVANRLYTVWPLGGSKTGGWTGLAGVLEAAWRASGNHGPARPPAAASPAYPGLEQGLAIICADSPNPRNPASYPAQAAFGYRRSGAFGPDVAWIAEGCATWPATDASGYYGPWNDWTSHPILVVSTTYDPATPYAGAVAMSRQLRRARLLTVHGYGHTTFLNPSTCVNQYEEAYFLNGTLPPIGTVCAQDKPPF